MRRRLAGFAAVLVGCLVMVAPAVAAPPPLSISAAPNPIIAGEGALVYGKLTGPDNASQPIYLYHRISPAAHFSLFGVTDTNSAGFYEFLSADGIVLTNRSWFVRGPGGTQSRVIHERIAALVSLGASATSADTGRAIVFAGQLTPEHAFQRVLLQEESPLGFGWTTIATGFTGGGSNFTLAHRWAQPGVYTLRVVFGGDARNVAGQSDPVTVLIQQAQTPAFTIETSEPTVAEAKPVVISGVLDMPGTTTPEAMKQVTLYGGVPGGEAAVLLATTETGPDGSYRFMEAPIHNEVYEVKVTHDPGRVSAHLYEGVQDVVELNTSASTGTVDGSDTFSGSVAPDQDGDAIYLQLLGPDGAWHNVESGVVGAGSTYSLTYSFGHAGATELRTRIYGRPENIGAASAPVTITITGVALLPSLPVPS